jgi:hypothetical protein
MDGAGCSNGAIVINGYAETVNDDRDGQESAVDAQVTSIIAVNAGPLNSQYEDSLGD